MGGTTIWERWDSMLPDGSINPGGMTSFNHYALGAGADFMHRVIGGLAPQEPGYRRVRIAPRPGGQLSSAATRHRTPYGDVAVQWHRDGEQLTVEVELPLGVTATVDLPDVHTEVDHGRHTFTTAYRSVDADPDRPSGTSKFERIVTEIREQVGAILS